MIDGRTWVVFHAGRPISLNKERGQHWSVRANETAVVREAGFWLAKEHKIPALGCIRVVATAVYPNKAKPLTDAGNTLPTVKAMVDGLVDAKVIPDDKGEFLTEIAFRAPTVVKGVLGMQLAIIEQLPAPSED